MNYFDELTENMLASDSLRQTRRGLRWKPHQRNEGQVEIPARDVGSYATRNKRSYYLILSAVAARK